MSVYAIALVKITDQEKYGRYVSNFGRVMSRFRGKVLAADSEPKLIEGTWDRERAVILQFPDEAAFHEFWDSPEYREIVKDRWAGATAQILLAKGFPGSD
jgi:uncharacterized protein (DUF1330 family)